MARGYYTRAVLAAWNWRDGTLTNIWTFDTGHTGTPNPYAGLARAGQPQPHRRRRGRRRARRDHVRRRRHRRRRHRPVHDRPRPRRRAAHDRHGSRPAGPGGLPAAREPRRLRAERARAARRAHGRAGLRRAGRRRRRPRPGPRRRPALSRLRDVGAGPTGGMYTAQLSTPNALFGPRGVEISPNKPSINFGVWWDGDLLRELLDGTVISKWDWLAGAANNVLAPAGIASNNGTKANPALSADILGDWREEVVWRETSSARAARSTRPPSRPPHRFYTLMHDRQYRPGDRLAADRLQPAAAPGLLPGRRHGAAAGAEHRHLAAARCSGPPRPSSPRSPTTRAPPPSDFVTADPTLVLGGTAPARHDRHRHAARRRRDRHRPGGWRRPVEPRLHGHGAARRAGHCSSAPPRDAGGHRRAAVRPRSRVTVDVTAPAAPVIADRVRGAGARGARARRKRAATVQVTLAGTGVVGTAPADAQGRWTLRLRRARPSRRRARPSPPPPPTSPATCSAASAPRHRGHRAWRRPRSSPSWTTPARRLPTASPPTTG